ncbi:MAG: hypothetical protein EOP53_17975 [Sphingobacteriales bacterium]|nr:MAG: hypothetical protein EOP53_17975 [Sphingobacteriales bacterium]
MNTIRSGFGKASRDKTLCKKMIDNLEALSGNNLCLAYLGGYQAVWANHIINPFSKLKTFNTGKDNIEKAIKKDPQNFEIRLVRFSIQKNAPAFLDYGQDQKSDEAFIIKNLHSVSNTVLKKLADEILKSE